MTIIWLNALYALVCYAAFPYLKTLLLSTAVANLKNALRSCIVKRVMLVIGNFKGSFLRLLGVYKIDHYSPL